MWDKIRGVINSKPVVTAILLGVGFVVGYVVKLYACT